MVVCALVHAPPTLASPNPTPPRGRGPWFFVVLVVVLLFSIAAGAIVVLIVKVRASASSNGPLPSAALSTVSSGTLSPASAGSSGFAGPSPHLAASRAEPLARLNVPADHSGRPTLAPPVLGQSTASVSGTSTAPAAAGTLGCICRSGRDALCPKDRLRPTQCTCRSVPDGYSLCPDPWDRSGGCPRERAFANNDTAKEGDPCTGYNYGTDKAANITNERLSGRYYICSVCADDAVTTFLGKEGSACVGYTSSRVPIAGVVDCSNLEYMCKRNDPAACAALPAHK